MKKKLWHNRKEKKILGSKLFFTMVKCETRNIIKLQCIIESSIINILLQQYIINRILYKLLYIVYFFPGISFRHFDYVRRIDNEKKRNEKLLEFDVSKIVFLEEQELNTIFY